ncbi:MAG: hypothetical protein AAGF94_19345 [Pseudomonadota bacterium]
MRLCAILVTVATLGLVGCDTAAPDRQTASFTASNGARVFPLGSGEFEVITRSNSAWSGYFCGASDYARIRLGRSPSDRVVVTQAIGPARTVPPGGRSVIFRVVPSNSGLPRTRFNPSIRRVGDNMSIGHARAVCDNRTQGFFASSN